MNDAECQNGIISTILNYNFFFAVVVLKNKINYNGVLSVFRD